MWGGRDEGWGLAKPVLMLLLDNLWSSTKHSISDRIVTTYKRSCANWLACRFFFRELHYSLINCAILSKNHGIVGYKAEQRHKNTRSSGLLSAFMPAAIQDSIQQWNWNGTIIISIGKKWIEGGGGNSVCVCSDLCRVWVWDHPWADHGVLCPVRVIRGAGDAHWWRTMHQDAGDNIPQSPLDTDIRSL